MKWTSTKPDKLGHWWWRDKAFPLSGGRKVIEVTQRNIDSLHLWGETCEWAGPIEPPQEDTP